MTTIGETVNGRALIHAMGLEDYYFDKQSRNVDTWNSYNHFSAYGPGVGHVHHVHHQRVFRHFCHRFCLHGQGFVQRRGVRSSCSKLLVLASYFLTFFSETQIMTKNSFTAIEPNP